MSQRYASSKSFCSHTDADNTIHVLSRNRLRVNRNALLPEYQTPPSSGRSSPFGGYQASGSRYADDLEGQNDEHLEGLTAKVKILKDVSNIWLYGRVMSWLGEWKAVLTWAFVPLIVDHDWDWQRSERFHGATQSDGTPESWLEAVFRSNSHILPH